LRLLPADLDTLSEGADPAIVEPADRPFLRAWIFPAERRSIETEAGIGLTAERVALGVDLDLRFAAGGLQDLRILVHLDQAIPPLGAVTELRFGGVSIPPSADRPSVEGGCDACWIQEANELRISVRAPARIEIR
ncbi:MAG: hypothetical protein OEY14_01470, partial [Myxococcales bacterium]|nr:hypothetical protein [Myxococcales bacterium]